MMHIVLAAAAPALGIPLCAPLGARHRDALPPPRGEGLRVALVSGNYNMTSDGANQALNRLAAHLLARGVRVRVYSPTVARPAFDPVGDLVSVPSLPIPGRRDYRLPVGLPGRIRDDIACFGPDIFHLASPDPLGMAALRLARQAGVPAVASLHTRFETYLDHHGLGLLRPHVERRLERFYRGADHVLAPNRPIAEELARAGYDRVSIWGRGVDHGRFDPARRDPAWRRAHGYGEEDVIILFFGRLVHEKGIDLFAQAIRRVRAAGRRVRPLIVGDGPARDRLAERLSNLVFTGHLTGDALGRAVSSADILLNPSTTEAFDNVTLEAMSAGLAVVAADVPSSRALIDPGRTGLLVPPVDVEGYAAALCALIDAPERRNALGAAARTASLHYRWPDMLDAVLRCYGDTLAAAAQLRLGEAPSLG